MTAVPSRITTTAAELCTALRAVRYAVGTNAELPMLTGVLLDVDDDAARVAASDRYRLAVSTLSGADVTGPAVSALLPVLLVDELLTLLTGDGPVTIGVAGDEITVEAAGRTLTGRRLDHDFPDYRRVLRNSATHRVDTDAATIRAQLAEAPTRVVRREEDGTDHEVSVLTLGADGGLSFEPGTAGVLEMGLDREFLLQALDGGAGGQLVLELDGPVAVLAIRDPARAGDVSMLMPIRLP